MTETAPRAAVTVQNPVLSGFHPDPSLLRVGDDYYLATSTFEWFPGVRVFHSRDLVHWRLAATPLDRPGLLDMRGNPDSCGIWAPCLSHDGERFHLIYTDVKSWNSGPFKDSHNYLTTAPSIEGPWSERVYLNSSGFDPSLFHDDDGRKWLVNMVWDHRAGHHPFAGIMLQEFDAARGQLVGEPQNIFTGTNIRLTEGPHLYKRDGWYYLLVAEGGTSYEHAASLARSRNIAGPYEIHPDNPVVSAYGQPDWPVQKAGHASMAPLDVQDGRERWLLAHLLGRPLTPLGECPLGRETGLQVLEWGDDGWPRLVGGGHLPAAEVALPALPPQPWPHLPARDDFDGPTLRPEWQSLRVPFTPEWCSLTDRPGHLRLYGRESPSSLHHQSLVGRRLEHLHASATTRLDFAPTNFQQMAGLACYYDTRHWVYLRLSLDEAQGRTLGLLCCDGGELQEGLPEVSVEGWPGVYLRVRYAGATFQFSVSADGSTWQDFGPAFDAGMLSDEHGGLSFTGTFLALCCQDLSGRAHGGRGLHADFDWFEYREG